VKSSRRPIAALIATLPNQIVQVEMNHTAGQNPRVNHSEGWYELLARVRSALKLKSELDRRHARERELLQFVSTCGDRKRCSAPTLQRLI
jgi:hypothetical protein